MPELSVVIVSYNTRELLARCLDALQTAATGAGLAVETIVVDNGSLDGSRDLVRERYPTATLIASPANLGFAGANNVGLARTQAPAVLLLNSDAFITAEALRRGLAALRSRPEAGLVGVRLVNPDGTTQAEYGRFPSLWEDIGVSLGADQLPGRRRLPAVESGPVDWVQGACMFVRAAALREIGPLDERFFMYSEEVDWCRRCWASGWQVWYLGGVAIVHVGGASWTEGRSSEQDLRRRAALYRGRLGLRRRLGGAGSSVLLWGCMLVGLVARAGGRALAQTLTRRRLGRQTPRADWALAREIVRFDPLARWATP